MKGYNNISILQQLSSSDDKNDHSGAQLAAPNNVVVCVFDFLNQRLPEILIDTVR